MKMPKKHKCDRCYNSRLVVSENGLHWVCTLKTKQAVDCFTGIKDWFISEEISIAQALMIYRGKEKTDENA